MLLPLVVALIAVQATRRAGMTALLAYAVAGTANLAVKQLLGRLRPGNVAETLLAANEKIYHHSFPSGHTTIAFAVAFGLAMSWPGRGRPLVAAASLLLATGVGISRIYRGVHWPSDVIGGALLGFIGASAAVLILSIRAQKSERAALEPEDVSENFGDRLE